jgi:hypothetical protein
MMLEYIYYNVNPKNRKTGDCSTRALVGTLGISYDEALQRQFKWASKTYYDATSKQVMEKVLSEFGYVKMKQPRKDDGTKYCVGEMNQLLTEKQLQEGVLVTVANHHTCITEGYVQDIWDCRLMCVGNYYVKP